MTWKWAKQWSVGSLEFIDINLNFVWIKIFEQKVLNYFYKLSQIKFTFRDRFLNHKYPVDYCLRLLSL